MLVPSPIGQPATGRFYSRAELKAEEEELMRQGNFQAWETRHDPGSDINESELDREQRKARERERKHAAVGFSLRLSRVDSAKADLILKDVYNMYLRHGWPDSFDKERCRAEVMELEKSKDEDERRRMEEANPDAALFD